MILQDALAAYHADLDDRGDERYAHVSDLYGCDACTWARRRGLPLIPHDHATRLKFAGGRGVEDAIAIELAAALKPEGWDLVRDVRVALGVTFDFAGSGTAPVALRGRVIGPEETPEADELIGHLDYLLVHEDGSRRVVEVKSLPTRRKDNQDLQWRHAMQAAAYALALDIPEFAVLAVYRADMSIAEHWQGAEGWRAQVLARAAQVLERTAPSNEGPPDAEQVEPWLSRYCRWPDCPHSTNPLRNKGLEGAA